MVPVKWLFTVMTYLFPDFVCKLNATYGHLPPEFYIEIKKRALPVFEGNSSMKWDRNGQ